MDFKEKPKERARLSMVVSLCFPPSVIDLISDDRTVWENEPLRSLALDGELMAYIHDGFWQPMDTLREKIF